MSSVSERGLNRSAADWLPSCWVPYFTGSWSWRRGWGKDPTLNDHRPWVYERHLSSAWKTIRRYPLHLVSPIHTDQYRKTFRKGSKQPSQRIPLVMGTPLGTALLIFNRKVLLGTDHVTKLNYFLKKIPNSLWPPLIFGKLCCNFLWQIWLHMCEEVWWPDSIEIQKCLPQSVSCLIFLNTIVENNILWTLKLLFCINFMIKKPCL